MSAHASNNLVSTYPDEFRTFRSPDSPEILPDPKPEAAPPLLAAPEPLVTLAGVPAEEVKLLLAPAEAPGVLTFDEGCDAGLLRSGLPFDCCQARSADVINRRSESAFRT
mmetsp:Transcript_19826/g.34192  ORF Transcript_19826/g.34192 Transcript_19826/m.34192 type:complete len:110 (+) Transcript_19826:404-733(+)